MVDMKREDRGDTGVVFVAQNIHSPSCGRPPEIRKDADLGLYHGYFENRFGEQFVFTFDGATEAGTISGGDLGWDEPKAFTLDLLAEALCSTLELAAKIEPGSLEAAGIPIVDAALALGRLTGLTGKDEVIWLRACLAACAPGWGILKERRSE